MEPLARDRVAIELFLPISSTSTPAKATYLSSLTKPSNIGATAERADETDYADELENRRNEAKVSSESALSGHTRITTCRAIRNQSSPSGPAYRSASASAAFRFRDNNPVDRIELEFPAAASKAASC